MSPSTKNDNRCPICGRYWPVTGLRDGCRHDGTSSGRKPWSWWRQAPSSRAHTSKKDIAHSEEQRSTASNTSPATGSCSPEISLRVGKPDEHIGCLCGHSHEVILPPLVTAVAPNQILHSSLVPGKANVDGSRHGESGHRRKSHPKHLMPFTHLLRACIHLAHFVKCSFTETEAHRGHVAAVALPSALSCLWRRRESNPGPLLMSCVFYGRSLLKRSTWL